MYINMLFRPAQENRCRRRTERYAGFGGGSLRATMWVRRFDYGIRRIRDLQCNRCTMAKSHTDESGSRYLVLWYVF